MSYFRSITLISVLMLATNGVSATVNTDLLGGETQTSSGIQFSYQTFASCSELEQTMRQLLPSNDRIYRGGIAFDSIARESMAIAPASVGSISKSIGTTPPKSDTNIQVGGIDEADTVKTDGKYIYSYQDGEQGIVILDAKNLERINTLKIPKEYSNPRFYITKNKLVLTATAMSPYDGFSSRWYDMQQKSIVAIYDIVDPRLAKLSRVIQLDGYLSDTRLADDGIMTIVSANSFVYPPLYRVMNTPLLVSYSASRMIPRILDTKYSGSRKIRTNTPVADCKNIGTILPKKESLSSYRINPTFTSILRLDISVPESQISSQVVLSEAGQIHVTRDSLYLTSQMWTMSTPMISKCAPNMKCMSPMIMPPQDPSTLLHRFALDKKSIQYVYSQHIAGSPLNQYSMDEDGDKNFRIVTQISHWGTAGTGSTRVSVLNSTGKVIGEIKNIAPGENFQSARFIGKRLYLVTFERIDPFFVIDLSLPTAPRILGELKIPGYSTYLHPYDDDRLIGIGYDTFVNSHGGTQNAGLKIDLYNVRDTKNPKQESSLILGDMGSSSDVLHDPHLFVYYKEKNLLLIPALLMKSAHNANNPYLASGVFQGVVGISILPSAITEKFRISHIVQDSTLNTEWKKSCEGYKQADAYIPDYCKTTGTIDMYLAQNIWNRSTDFVSRVLYVGDSLYTLGQSRIQMQSFANTKIPLAIEKLQSPQAYGYPQVSVEMMTR